MDKEYTLCYLPTFEEDMAGVRDYIAIDLANPIAALRLIEDTEKAIQRGHVLARHIPYLNDIGSEQ